jgi:hypothetical protein
MKMDNIIANFLPRVPTSGQAWQKRTARKLYWKTLLVCLHYFNCAQLKSSRQKIVNNQNNLETVC